MSKQESSFEGKSQGNAEKAINKAAPTTMVSDLQEDLKNSLQEYSEEELGKEGGELKDASSEEKNILGENDKNVLESQVAVKIAKENVKIANEKVKDAMIATKKETQKIEELKVAVMNDDKKEINKKMKEVEHAGKMKIARQDDARKAVSAARDMGVVVGEMKKKEATINKSAALKKNQSVLENMSELRPRIESQGACIGLFPPDPNGQTPSGPSILAVCKMNMPTNTCPAHFVESSCHRLSMNLENTSSKKMWSS